MTELAGALTEYDKALARKRVAAGVLFFNDAGQVLLVDPVYKAQWEIPGGAVEAEESPRAGACREVLEELGLDLAPGVLLGVDWTAARPGRSEGLVTVFDGGRLTPEQVGSIRLQDEELRGYAFVDVESVGELLLPVLARRVQACVRARAQGRTVYLENGCEAG
ncbi:NUDIX domain-containing protein [Streptomyces sp. NPDC001744]|uniref:NUDIX domain-containing protein n=1 Tax=Streptomyces sp. NPDC001744 TaxID=3364606 RepID=UPI0036B37E67